MSPKLNGTAFIRWLFGSDLVLDTKSCSCGGAFILLSLTDALTHCALEKSNPSSSSISSRHLKAWGWKLTDIWSWFWFHCPWEEVLFPLKRSRASSWHRISNVDIIFSLVMCSFLSKIYVGVVAEPSGLLSLDGKHGRFYPGF